MAGESAREVARMRREKAERLNRLADAFERGAEGEEATARALQALPGGWRVLNDVRWPGRRYANIDHVVIGPTGVYIIDSKLWAGTITVVNDVLRVNGYKRETVVAGVADSAIAVAEQVPGLDPFLVKPVLCFVRDQDLSGSVRDVLVCSTSDLVPTLTSRATLLDEAGIRSVHGWLSRSLQSAAATRAMPAWPPPSPRGPARSSTPRAPKPTRSRGRRGGTGALRSCLGALLGLGLLVGGAVLVFNLLGAFGDLVKPRVPTPTDDATTSPALPLGAVVRLPRATGRPPLRVEVDRARTTRSTQGLEPYVAYHRLFAVRLRITNIGRHMWISQPGTVATVSGSLAVPQQPTSRYPVVQAGRALPNVIRLKPGRSMRRVMVFEVPTDEPITSFSLTVGPGAPRTATWVIDRQ